MNDTPRFTRAMGVLRWVVFGAMAVFAVIMALSYFDVIGGSAPQDGAVRYHCPMHPTYLSAQPGDCPICGMSLVPIPQDNEAEGQYTCPMHPEVVAHEPGRCPECGMFLEPVKAGEGAADRPGNAGTSRSAGRGLAVSGLVPVTLEPRRIQMIGLKTGVVARRAIGDDARAAGYVAADETRTASVNVRAGGWVRKLHVDQTGARVSKGDPLLTIYSQDLYGAQQDFVVALSARDRSGADEALGRSRDSLVDASRDRLRLLGMSDEDVSRLEETRQAASELTLKSPVTGVVLEKTVLEGQFVMPEQSLFQVSDLRTIWVLADIYEKDIASVEKGAAARMTVTALPGEVFEGKISFVYPSVSQTTRTLKVRLEFANPESLLRPGMYAEVECAGGGSEVTAVPAEAVMDGGETRYVFVVHHGTRFDPRLVRTGRRSNDWIEILSGVEIGDTVVTSANFLIDSESRLKAAIAGMGGGQETGGERGEHTH
jgi:Cu(I)/Ag(I) efflux system membrane fusion protein